MMEGSRRAPEILKHIDDTGHAVPYLTIGASDSVSDFLATMVGGVFAENHVCGVPGDISALDL